MDHREEIPDRSFLLFIAFEPWVITLAASGKLFQDNFP